MADNGKELRGKLNSGVTGLGRRKRGLLEKVYGDSMCSKS